MSKLARKTLLQFGSTVNAGSEIGQFGSYASPIYSADVTVLQAGTAWPRGWAAETVAVNRPFLEDINAVDYVFGYMLAYILQQGIAEWDAGTTYYTNSIVQSGGSIYASIQDNNLNHAVTDTAWWSNGIAQPPTGTINAFAGAIIPSGYLLCDGSAVSRLTYAALFALVGTTYGVGNGTTTFNIPDMRQRAPVGYKSGDSDFGTLGATGGEKTHTLITAEMPAHTHLLGVSANEGATDNYAAAATVSRDAVATTDSAGGGGAHNNLQPFLTLNFVIKT